MFTGFVLASAVTGALAVAAAPLGFTALLSLRYPEPASLVADRGNAPATRTLAGPPAPAPRRARRTGLERSESSPSSNGRTRRRRLGPGLKEHPKPSTLVAADTDHVRQHDLSYWEVAIRKLIAKPKTTPSTASSLSLAVPFLSPRLFGFSGEQPAVHGSFTEQPPSAELRSGCAVHAQGMAHG
jgi:hypothetical protein